MSLFILVFDDFDMKECLTKVDNKINEAVSCLGELICKHTKTYQLWKVRAG